MKTKIQFLLRNMLLTIILSSLFSCTDYLDLKPNKSLVIPSELKDLQALLDNSSVMNFYTSSLGEMSSDNIYLSDIDWKAQDDAIRNLYIWGDEIFYNRSINSWLDHYQVIYYANYVIEALEKINLTETNKLSWNQIKGSSFFLRAFCFYNLVTTFSMAYDIKTAKEDLGIPLRLSSDFNTPSVRASVEDSYHQIIDDLNKSIILLPERSDTPLRASRIAAYALLSRVYMAMRNYQLADEFAKKCLMMDDSLIDFNELNYLDDYPIPAFNKEVLFSTGGGVISNNRIKIDTNLYKSYEDSDLRKQVFFSLNADGNSHQFKGSYNGRVSNVFTGVALDEVYLNRAESLTRLGEFKEGLIFLNRLLAKRHMDNEFSEVIVDNPEDALRIILRERRKELVMRDVRWMDIKRLNKEVEGGITVRRNLLGEIYELKPNENRFALPLPEIVIEMTNMVQNPR